MAGIISRRVGPGEMRTWDGEPRVNVVRELIDDIVPPNQSWLFKCGIDLWDAFKDFHEDTRFIFIRRPVEETITSVIKYGKGDPKKVRRLVEWRYQFMHDIADECGAVWVDTPRIIAKDYQQLRQAIEHGGAEFRSHLAEERIDRRMWSGKV